MLPLAEVPTLVMESNHTSRVTMNIFIFLLLAICMPIHATKESFEHGIKKSDERLLREIIKRLGSADFNYLGTESSSSVGAERKQTVASESDKQTTTTCEPSVRSGTIIKAHESINAGAVYIDSIKGVKTNANCLEYCCRNTTCDVAVYQDKDDRYCYLFQCKGRCIFKDHSGYFVGDIQHVKAIEQPEEDLKNLNPDLPGEKNSEEEQNGQPVPNDDAKNRNEPVSVPETTEKVIEPSRPVPEEPVIAPHSVGLKGYCIQDRHCEDPNAICTGGNCLCHDGYYNKEGLCRKVCLPSSFECFELGTLSRGPECIPKSQVCDSYMQCADGSDEFNCEKIDFPSGSRPQKPSSLHKDKVFKPHSPEHESSHTDNKGKDGKVQAPKPNVPPSKAPTVVSTVKHKTNSSVSPHKDKANTTTPKPATTAHESNKHVFMASEKVIIASATSEAEGPIIALSLGLAFTLILLVLVGCRLRNVRHRLRKGRPLHQNEADYLINGMYL